MRLSFKHQQSDLRISGFYIFLQEAADEGEKGAGRGTAFHVTSGYGEKREVCKVAEYRGHRTKRTKCTLHHQFTKSFTGRFATLEAVIYRRGSFHSKLVD